jgi:hypothetical protein
VRWRGGMASGWRLGDTFIKTVSVEEGRSSKSIYHYTTKIIEVREGEVTALDGFSLTDYMYIRSVIPNGYNVLFRKPRRGNSAVIVDSRDGIIIPMMSYDIMAFNDDVARFYLKPLRDKIGLRDLDDVRYNAIVSNQYGEFVEAKHVKPQRFPYIRMLCGNKPDLSVALYYNVGGRIVKNFLDIYNKYYFVVDSFDNRNILFLGYLLDIQNTIIPPIHPIKEHLDPWRARSKPLDFVGDWVRLTDSEWAGAWSASAMALYKLEEALKALVRRGVFKALATVVSYTSNIFVVYVDFYVKPRNLDSKTELIIENIKSVVERIEKLELLEILKNVFNIG